MDWAAALDSYLTLHAERTAALLEPPADGARDDLRVAGVATAAWAAGLAALMLGRCDEARPLLREAAAVYRQSYAVAPPGSWGRPLAALRCRLIAGDEEGARADAEWTLAEGAAASDSPIGRYAAALALATLERDADAAEQSAWLLADGRLSPRSVAEALAAVAARDAGGYAASTSALLSDFEAREAFLENVAVADTVLVLDRLASARGLLQMPRSSLLLPQAVPR
jgi:hypothetical protein